MSSVTPEAMPAGHEEAAPVIANGGGNEQYGDAFPALSSRGPAPAQMNGKPDPIGTKKPGTASTPAAPSIRSSVITQVGYICHNVYVLYSKLTILNHEHIFRL